MTEVPVTIVDPDVIGRALDIVAKTLEECQNGLRQRDNCVPIQREGWMRPEVEAALRSYAESIDAEIQGLGSGWEIVVPRARVAVTLESTAVRVSGRRVEGPGHRHLIPWDRPRNAGVDGNEVGPTDVWGAADTIASASAPGASVTATELRTWLESDSRLLASLASDMLNRRGFPEVPRFVRDDDPDADAERVSSGSPTDDVWESRISVDEYALFEATHPAYAVQVLALAHMVRQFLGHDPTAAVDIGPGPGLTTIMFAELFPVTTIDAVDPSPSSFRHLVRSVGGHRIRPFNSGVADFRSDTPYPVALSVGASHHLDTRIFLRSMRRLVAPGGLILIADEMISPFVTEDQRARILVDHHMSYIDDALRHIDPDTLPAVEQRRLLALRRIDRSRPEALGDALEELRRDRVRHPGAAGPWQRVRFAVLEFEAMVAGIDYDVERKTYPANFLDLAWDEGLELLGHRRVHPTVGDSPGDAGTHVIALRAPGPPGR